MTKTTAKNWAVAAWDRTSSVASAMHWSRWSEWGRAAAIGLLGGLTLAGAGLAVVSALGPVVGVGLVGLFGTGSYGSVGVYFKIRDRQAAAASSGATQPSTRGQEHDRQPATTTAAAARPRWSRRGSSGSRADVTGDQEPVAVGDLGQVPGQPVTELAQSYTLGRLYNDSAGKNAACARRDLLRAATK